MKNYNKLIISILVTSIILNLFFNFNSNLFAITTEADQYKEEGDYEKAIEEYRKYEDFYNYFLLRSVNNPRLYKEYSLLLSEILIKMAETYQEWGKFREAENYCNKVLFVYRKLNGDADAELFKIQAEKILNEIDTKQIVARRLGYEINDGDIQLNLILEDSQSLLSEEELSYDELLNIYNEISFLFSETEKSLDKREIIDGSIAKDIDSLNLLEIDKTEDIDGYSKIITEQNFNPLEGPVASQYHIIDDYKSSITLHLSKFGQELEQKVDTPYNVSITDGENVLSSKNGDVDIKSINSEQFRFYLGINLNKEYSQENLKKLSNSLVRFILSIPTGCEIFLVYHSEPENTIKIIKVNAETIENFGGHIGNIAKNTESKYIFETIYDLVDFHDNEYGKKVRFMSIITDDVYDINVGISNEAMRKSIPIYIFSIGDELSNRSRIVLSRLTNNTFGTYFNGNLNENLSKFLYNIALYFVQSSYVVSWDHTKLSTGRNLEIKVDFLYKDINYTIDFNTSLLP